ncbi:Low-salt glycan biosynthesis protein Agl12 [Chlamydiales bacterium SCGC AB-751-O23]|jgi:dTDP-glucose 4,6-dehydratase|nr:Low-salt glycan biosynthesis protein Agl12 [Chlamydiales bacterium SCGC AB-751-O23]
MRRVLFLFIMFLQLGSIENLAAENRIFITGGAGFIGSNFLSYMVEKYPSYKFVVLDTLTSGSLENIPEEIRNSNRVEIIEGSVLDSSLVENIMTRITHVVHFAAEVDVLSSINGDDVFFQANVDGTRKLMQVLIKEQDHIERFINISSASVYGNYEEGAISEDNMLMPINPYGASKTAADRLVYAYGKSYDLPVLSLRLFNNFGPRQKLGAIPAFIARALAGQQISIHGDGKQQRDWLFVTDTARAIDLALHKVPFSDLRNEVFNLGTAKETSVIEAATKITHEVSADPGIITHVPDVPGQVKRNFSNSEKALKVLSWEPEVSFDEGLLTTIAWYKKHPKRCMEILKR